MKLDFTAKNVAVTGGGSGIGKAISVAFAAQGARVHIIELREELCADALQAIADIGGTAFGYGADVSQQARVLEVFAQIGPVDVLINNAGIAHIGKAHTTSEQDLDRLYRVNIKGAYNTLFAVLPGMQERGGGVILNLCSIAAHVGLTDRFAYSMTKGAIHAMTLSVARDYLADNIRCNCVSPARVHTPFVDGFLKNNYAGRETEMFEKLSKSQPIGRMGKPEEVANLALFLCSEEAGFLTGCDYPIDGGFITLNT